MEIPHNHLGRAFAFLIFMNRRDLKQALNHPCAVSLTHALESQAGSRRLQLESDFVKPSSSRHGTRPIAHKGPDSAD